VARDTRISEQLSDAISRGYRVVVADAFTYFFSISVLTSAP
jgi:hypothetical protein